MLSFSPGVNKRYPAIVATRPRAASRVPALTRTDQHMSTPMDNSRTDCGTDVIIDASASSDDEFGTIVLTTIADELGTDPASLPPLRDSIDPDILNGFFDADGESAKALSFEYLGYHVVVTDDGIIQLRSLA